jgi:hypothetical protein
MKALKRDRASLNSVEEHVDELDDIVGDDDDHRDGDDIRNRSDELVTDYPDRFDHIVQQFNGEFSGRGEKPKN